MQGRAVQSLCMKQMRTGARLWKQLGNVAKRETMERLDKTIPGGFKKNRQESTVVVSEVATVYVSTRLPDAPSHPSSHLPAASL
jgi:uncharacterized protein YPO0396